MRSPIAKVFRAASHFTEFWHRQLHGPKFAPGDLVEYKRVGTLRDHGVLLKKQGLQWLLRDGGKVDESKIVRVVTYG